MSTQVYELIEQWQKLNDDNDDDTHHLGCENCASRIALCGAYEPDPSKDRICDEVQPDCCPDCVEMVPKPCLQCGGDHGWGVSYD